MPTTTISPVPSVAALVLLLVASFSTLPSGFYTLLRLVVCGSAAYNAFNFRGKPESAWMWAMIGIALLFNPLVPVSFSSDVWTVLDLLSASAFAAFILPPHFVDRFRKPRATASSVQPSPTFRPRQPIDGCALFTLFGGGVVLLMATAILLRDARLFPGLFFGGAMLVIWGIAILKGEPIARGHYWFLAMIPMGVLTVIGLFFLVASIVVTFLLNKRTNEGEIPERSAVMPSMTPDERKAAADYYRRTGKRLSSEQRVAPPVVVETPVSLWSVVSAAKKSSTRDLPKSDVAEMKRLLKSDRRQYGEMIRVLSHPVSVMRVAGVRGTPALLQMLQVFIIVGKLVPIAAVALWVALSWKAALLLVVVWYALINPLHTKLNYEVAARLFVLNKVEGIESS